MSLLQDYCDAVEKEFDMVIQIKKRIRPAYIGKITETKLIIRQVAGDTRGMIESDWCIDPLALKWWINGVLQGISYLVAHYKAGRK